MVLVRDLLLRVAQRPENFLAVLIHHLAVFVQEHLPSVAVKQLGAQLLLQRFDIVAYGRSENVGLLRGLADAVQLRRPEKILQLQCVHVSTSVRVITGICHRTLYHTVRLLIQKCKANL